MEHGFTSCENVPVLHVNGVPVNFVHSIFLTYPQDRAYVAANRSPVTSILGIIRAGRAPEQKTRLVQALWQMSQDNTGVPDSDLSVALHEVAPSQAMENGTIMPEIGHEKETF
jgi:phenylpyruvate tautomerase PptA (4-oxalocrotonate tautomerase family)